MKRFAWIAIASACALSAPLALANNHEDKAPLPPGTIEMVGDIWCPYSCAQDSSAPGFIVEIVQQAFKKHGITVHYVNEPWKRAVEHVRDGKHHMLSGAAKTDVEGFILPEAPQGKMSNAFYVKKGSGWKYENLDSLGQVSLGLVSGYTFNNAIDGYVARHKHDMKRLQFISAKNAAELNVQKLLAGRVGAVLEDEQVMRYTLRMLGKENEVEKAGMLPESPNDYLYVPFSPAIPESVRYAALLSEEMTAMRKSGELKKILDRYGVADWHK